MRSTAYRSLGRDPTDVQRGQVLSDIRTALRLINSAHFGDADTFDVQCDVAQDIATVAAVEEWNADDKSILVRLLNPPSDAPGASTGDEWASGDMVARLIMEEGKVNLVLRAMIDAADRRHRRDADVALLQALDIVVRCGFKNFAGLQTVDMHAFLNHVGQVLRGPFDAHPPPDAGVLLHHEAFAVVHLSKLAAHFERLNGQTQELLMDRLAGGLFDAVLRHLAWLGPRVLFAGEVVFPSLTGDFPLDEYLPLLATKEFPDCYVVFLASLFSTEEFKTRLKEFFPTPESKQRFVSTVQPLCNAYASVVTIDQTTIRRLLRPITDLLLRFK